MKTYIAKDTDLENKVYLVNAEGKTLGRLATKVASLLLGKEKPTFSYDKMVGDQVILINASKVYISGNKKKQKEYDHYSGHPSGRKTYTFEELIEKNPEEIIRRAVSRMLPKNHLGRQMIKRLFIYSGSEHNQQAQKPVALEV